MAYYGAHRLGRWVLQEPPLSEAAAAAALAESKAAEPVDKGWREHPAHGWTYLSTVGKLLAMGPAIVATVCGIAVYFIASVVWIPKTRWTRGRRLAQRNAGAQVTDAGDNPP